MEVYGTERSDGVKRRSNREFWAVLFSGRTSHPPSERCCPSTFGKHFLTALISPPRTTSHISSASPVRMFLSDTKIKTVGISPFCFHYSFALKNTCFFLLFFLLLNSSYLFSLLNSRRLFLILF